MEAPQAVSALLVRSAGDQDMARVADIYAEAVLHGTATFEVDPPGLEEMSRRWRSLVERGYPFLVCDAGGSVAGYAYAGPYHHRPAYRHTLEDSVYVAPDHAGRGIGKALLEQLIVRAEASDFRQMIAVIGDSRNSASINLHRALGFTFSGVLHGVGRKHGRWLDTVLMQRALGPGGATSPTR